MLSRSDILAQIPNVLSETSLEFLGEKYEGKVRDNYVRGNVRYLITTDRVSCFDAVVSTIPFKGQALNQMAVHWFERSRGIIPNHIIDVPDPNVMVVRNCEMLPVEVVMRAYLAGSAWRDYQAGKAVSGVLLPEGLKNCAKLPEVIVTPSTKAEKGTHDEPISEEKILSSGLVERKLWEKIVEVSRELFSLGQDEAAAQGLILVDTKYEFGLLDGELVLADEIHTMDSSRYWEAATYMERFESGRPPEMFDKEPTRQWLLSKGYKGQGEIPRFTDDHRADIAGRYLCAFERITGKPLECEVGAVSERIERNLKTYLDNASAAA